jgi:HD-GYP domain-containing protein (c-di-GMP phosphodiesterase class II)
MDTLMGKHNRTRLALLLTLWSLIAIALTVGLPVVGAEVLLRQDEVDAPPVIYFTIASCVVMMVILPIILFAATRGMNAEYERLLYLYKTGQSIRSSLDLVDVLGQVARDAALYTGANAGLATLADEETNDLILRASYIPASNTTAQHHRALDQWYLRRCVATGEIVRERESSISFLSFLGDDSLEEGPVSVLCVPIAGRERSIGVLTVLRQAALGDFRLSEVQMICEMAAQSAMAVEQALLFAKVRTYADEVEVSYDSTLKVLMAALDTKDAVTQGHSERVARLTVAVAREMGIPSKQLIDIERGALLHDVGKIGVPDSVLLKEAPLTEGEWEAMQKHPLLAGLMVSKVGFLENAMPIMLYHHERYDGTGYPFGLEGDAIPLEARIFAAVDAYDAMTSDRPYRKALPHEEALRDIQRNSGIQFDPQVVEVFTRVMTRAKSPPAQAEGEVA